MKVSRLWNDTSQKVSAGNMGEIVKIQCACAFVSSAAAGGDQASELTIGLAIGRPENDIAGCGDRQFTADDQF